MILSLSIARMVGEIVADYWLKLYLSIIEDPKMALLSDRLWRRVIELNIIAKIENRDGLLPDPNQIAWRLRLPVDELQLDMQEILKAGIVQQTSNGLLVTDFAQKQAPVSDAERKRQQRERKRKAPVTIPSRNVTESQSQSQSLEEIKRLKEVDDSDSTNLSTEFGDLEEAFILATGLPVFIGGAPKWLEAFKKLKGLGAASTDITRAVETLIDKDYSIVGPSSIINAVAIEIGKRNGKQKKRDHERKRYSEGEFADWIEN